ncbi:D-alanyl-D-alanine carboxypeptidase family protein [Candidatus Cetobacterium colombiensis]|uniref:serine-type D-Ala-D-Ala carboxypeptidase n=1 Tax=Candidatus Cetobacterium colombiensis TaxID=3073100 RepID=A0ABU4WFB1_9FUSO|nr:D-alanyl-D-alanine carboxypeptidase family protein [Candidatus Cetobacterium colombiensis]MDX8337178.1 D-alanyl-D-alanine carboxypeptidase family protein [Candidatus Cetobacterium colombiensis]
MKKLVVIFTLVASTLSFSKSVPKSVVKDNIPNYRAYVVGDDKGNIFYQENATKKYPLASVTKVMTIIVTLDEIRKGNISLYDEVSIDWEILSVGGSAIPMQSGEKITVIDLLKSAAIKSANNAAYALAKHSGKGSIPRFVDMMNEKAKSLGLENDLEFYTPAGLPDHMTKKKLDMGTAEGIYRLSIEALKYPEYIAIARQKTAEIKNGEYKLKSTIHLLDKEGIYGLKTGYHTKSRFNITILSNKDNANIVTVVMGGKSPKIRDEKVLELNKEFHENYKNKDIIKKDISVLSIPISNAYVSDVKVYGTKSYSQIVKKDADISIETEREKKLVAPIKAGTVVGSYKVLINGEVVFKDDLIVKKDVEKKKIMDRIMEIF